jgi:hypothetical protein
MMDEVDGWKDNGWWIVERWWVDDEEMNSRWMMDQWMVGE